MPAAALRVKSAPTSPCRLQPAHEPAGKRRSRRYRCAAAVSLRFVMRECTSFAYQVLTDPRQWIADQHIYDSAASITSGDQDGIGGLFMNLPDDAGFFSAFRLLQRIQGHVSIVLGDDGEKLTFIRDMKRIQSKQFAGA